MISLLAVAGSSNPASQTPTDAGMLWLLLLVFGVGGALLFVTALVLSLMRSGRMFWAKRRDRLAIPPRNDLRDAWKESAARMPTDTDAPREPNPDDDLPPMGGRFR